MFTWWKGICNNIWQFICIFKFMLAFALAQYKTSSLANLDYVLTIPVRSRIRIKSCRHDSVSHYRYHFIQERGPVHTKPKWRTILLLPFTLYVVVVRNQASEMKLFTPLVFHYNVIFNVVPPRGWSTRPRPDSLLANSSPTVERVSE